MIEINYLSKNYIMSYSKFLQSFIIYKTKVVKSNEMLIIIDRPI